MKTAMVAFVSGFVFALGLSLSGMTQPHKVIGFLDLFGEWDPSLIFVMLGAIGVHFFAYRWIAKMPAPLLSPRWHLPTKKDIPTHILIGSALFGIGWALAGFCPGPALTSLGAGSSNAFLFVPAMIIGMYAYRLWSKWRQRT